MKINEFRALIQKAERAQLEIIAGELYRNRQAPSPFPNYPKRLRHSLHMWTLAITASQTASCQSKNAPNGDLR